MSLGVQNGQYTILIRSTNELIRQKNNYTSRFVNSNLYPYIYGLYVNLEITYADFLVEYSILCPQCPSVKLCSLADRLKNLSVEILNLVNS